MPYLLFSHEDCRQLLQCREVDGLKELALVGGAVAVQREGDAAVALVLVRKGEAGAERGLGADDAVAAEEVGRRAVHVHRAALALGRP